MARRSDHSRQELTELALDKSLEIIDEKGLSGFSARAVAERMGYTVGTLYNVFGSYDGLIFRVNARILDAWHAALAAGLHKTKKDKMRYLAYAYLDFAGRHYNRWTTLFEFHAKSSPPDWYRDRIDRHFRLIEETLLARTQDPHQNRRRAKVLWASIHGICILALGGKLDVVGSDSAKTLIDDLLENYLGAA